MYNSGSTTCRGSTLVRPLSCGRCGAIRSKCASVTVIAHLDRAAKPTRTLARIAADANRSQPEPSHREVASHALGELGVVDPN